MITTIIAWIYITALCYCWGNLLLGFMLKRLKWQNNTPFHFSVICLTGLIIIAAIVQMLSLFIPLHGWLIHIPFIIPCFFTSYSGIQPGRIKALFQRLLGFSLQLQILLALCLLLVLLMSTWLIAHPDTLEYHIEIIKWIQQAKATPGIANANVRLGLQSAWFPACAFFSFSHLGIAYYVHLNAIVAIWVIIFIISQIEKNRESNLAVSILWTLLLCINLWSYTQIRLTVTSTSPDFIAAIYILLSFYFFYTQHPVKSRTAFILTLYFLIFSLCIKLSSLPVLILFIYLLAFLISERKYKMLFASLPLPFILLSASLFRNAISSGYMFFPSTFLNIIDTPWKLNENICKYTSAYITAYAKTASDSSHEAVKTVNAMPLREWVPIWWNLRSAADKLIVSFSLLSILTIILQVKKIQKLGVTKILCIITAITGTLFWFVLAPDPRFGFGFLLSLIGIALQYRLGKLILNI